MFSIYFFLNVKKKKLFFRVINRYNRIRKLAKRYLMIRGFNVLILRYADAGGVL